MYRRIRSRTIKLIDHRPMFSLVVKRLKGKRVTRVLTCEGEERQKGLRQRIAAREANGGGPGLKLN